MKEFFKNLPSIIGKGFKYMGWTIIDPTTAFNELVKEKYQAAMGIMVYLISCILFMPVLMQAKLHLRPSGWVPLNIKGITSEMIYVYFAKTAPYSIILVLLVFPIVEFAGMLAPRKNALQFRETFSTCMMGLNMVVIFDFFTEGTAILYLFICKWTGKPEVFSQGLKLFMFFTYGMMFLWMIMLVTVSARVVKKVEPWQAFVTGVVGTLVYWVPMGYWIA